MAVTAEAVKALRERTGAAMMECKKGLVEATGDLGAAADADDALVRLTEALAESDRDVVLALLRVDSRAGMIRERTIARGGKVEREATETSLEQLPSSVLRVVRDRGMQT